MSNRIPVILLSSFFVLFLLSSVGAQRGFYVYDAPVFGKTGGGGIENVVAGKGMNCSTFREDEVPEGWQVVESCSEWYNLVEANQTLEEAEEYNLKGEALELLNKAKQEYQEGNYTGANQLAQKAIENRSKGLPTFVLVILVIVILVGAGAGIFFLLRQFRDKRVVREVKKLNSEMERLFQEVQRRIGNKRGGWRVVQKMRQMLQESTRLSQSYQNMGTKKTASQLRMLERELRRVLNKARREYGVRLSYRKYKGASKLEKLRIRAEIKIFGVIRKIRSFFEGLF